MKEFFDLLRFVKPYKGFVLLSIISNVLMALFMVVSIPAIIPFFQILFERTPPVVEAQVLSFSNIEPWVQYQFSALLSNNTKEGALALVCFVLVGLFFFKNFFRYMSMFFMAIVRNGMVKELRQKLFEKYLDLPFAYFSTERKGDLISRVTTDVQEIENSILRMLVTVFREPIVIIGSIAFMIIISPKLTLFVFALILFTVVVIGGVSRTLRRKSRVAQDKLANIVSIVEESLGGMRIIKAFNGEHLQERKFLDQNDGYRHVMTRILWRNDLSSPLSEFLGIAVVVVLLWYGSKQVFSGQLAAETFFAFLFAFYNVISPAKSFSSAYYFVQKGLASVDRINEIMSLDNPISDVADPISIDEFSEGIIFDNVSFSYPGTDVEVLKNINLNIKKGEIIALVGASGSGKSTLADLIPRFHDPSNGRILIDGIDIKDYKIKELRNQMGIVSQEAILFNDSIRNNIIFSENETDDIAVEKASRYANAHEFILNTEAQYDTVIGDRGMKLSGGQRQRLTIARALLKNPPILILDEATAALDSESEKLVQDALDHVMTGRTSVIIAHRLSTIRHANAIYVMKEGRIVEHGSHDELIKLDGEYRKFVGLQAFD